MQDDFIFDSLTSGEFSQSFNGAIGASEQWRSWIDPTLDPFTLSESLVDHVTESYNLATIDPLAIGIRLQRELLETVLHDADGLDATSTIFASIHNGATTPKSYFSPANWVCMSLEAQEYCERLWARKAEAIVKAQRMADELNFQKTEDAIRKDQWPEDYFGEYWAALSPKMQSDLIDYWNRLAMALD